MQTNNIWAKIQEALFKKAAPHFLTAIIGAATAYLVDRGFLDGEGADEIANKVIELLTLIGDKVF